MSSRRPHGLRSTADVTVTSVGAYSLVRIRTIYENFKR